MKAFRVVVPVVLVVAVAVVVPVTVSRAGEPASASASTSASVSPPASGSARGLPRFADELPPPEKSTLPSVAEWRAAARFRFDRALPSACDATRVREWVRVTCTGMGATAGQVVGPPEGFDARVPPPIARKELGYLVQFPVRSGERRLIELRSAVWGDYDGSTLYAGGSILYLSIQWNDGETPLLVAQDGA